MSLKAYVLINTKIGKTTEVAKKLKQMPSVKRIDIIMGPYDIIAEVEADEHESLAHLVMDKFQIIEDINHTMTCPVVSIDELS